MDLAIWLIIKLLQFVVWLLKMFFKLVKHLLESQLEGTALAPKKKRSALSSPSSEPSVSWATRVSEEQRDQLVTALVDIEERARRLREAVRRDRASEHLAPVLETSIAQRAQEGRERLQATTGLDLSVWEYEVQWLKAAQDTIEDMVAQRRTGHLRAALGDADALARACYQPIIDFARMQRVPLSSAAPVTLFTEYDLSIWTGFASSGLAPIFLPPDFFDRLAWWPALAHEIGHDVLASTTGADQKLRAQLGLTTEAHGRVPLGVITQDVSWDELYRLAGGWFEEIFCDVFATLMLGPAYVHTMKAVFGNRAEPAAVLTQGVADETTYARHPPRHLRVDLCCRLLGRFGHESSAKALWEEWDALHGHPENALFPVPGGTIAVPLQPLMDICESIAERLYDLPLAAFDGHSLPAIPGGDYGPHAWKEAERARDAMLAGRLPRQHEPRSVIAGAILAWKAQPSREHEFLQLARVGIVGVTEWAEAGTRGRVAGAGREAGPVSARDAFVLHTLFAPPPALCRRARSAMRGRVSVAPRR